jgi:mRNA-degrading endonuclease RelE of RelBE toxin-antitoxin system
MKIIKILPSFERSLKKLSSQDKEKLKKSLRQLNDFLTSGILPAGLGFKKINHNKYELRVDIHLRVIVKIESNFVYLVLVGNHNDLKRFLRGYK